MEPLGVAPQTKLFIVYSEELACGPQHITISALILQEGRLVFGLTKARADNKHESHDVQIIRHRDLHLKQVGTQGISQIQAKASKSALRGRPKYW